MKISLVTFIVVSILLFTPMFISDMSFMTKKSFKKQRAYWKYCNYWFIFICTITLIYFTVLSNYHKINIADLSIISVSITILLISIPYCIGYFNNFSKGKYNFKKRYFRFIRSWGIFLLAINYIFIITINFFI